ncbi:hypothetical protein VA599_16640 [Chromobacterium sp. TRC.1.1.SA]|uniref:Uncharacterized protein n=1 Tax=Chromobacterium indicum TaxID=3110228 RepID=A0ABV0CQY1_9NEIS
MDYSIFYKRTISTERIKQEIPHFDIFISAFNTSDRVQTVFDNINATEKFWLLHPEYDYDYMDVPVGQVCIKPSQLDEMNQVDQLISALPMLTGKRICIDITGFMRHVLSFLIAKLAYLDIRTFDVIYSEPISYSKAEDTLFSTETSGVVRPVRGMAGSNITGGKDHLIIGVGFDSNLISLVSHQKDDAETYPLFAFPSLSADMYQQSAIRAAKSGEVALQNEWLSNRLFAPANDPFATAQVLSELISKIDRKHPESNIYLSPLSTKAQALGFALYWCLEGRQRKTTSILLPECIRYSRETSTGLRRLWLYTIEI